MLRVDLLSDTGIKPPPLCGTDDVQAALQDPLFTVRVVDLSSCMPNRDQTDVLVIPYLEGPLEGRILDGILAFHAEGGGLVFLGDTPQAGRSYPYRNALAPDLRLTRCQDTLILRGLSPIGHEVFGELPGMTDYIGKHIPCVRTSAYPPDTCRMLVEASDHLKDLGPVVLVERNHPDFLGAKLAVAGFDGGEPRENILGVCQRPWIPNYGLLDRAWDGLHPMIAGLVRAVAPPKLAVAIDFDPVIDEADTKPVMLLARNFEPKALEATYACSTHPAGRLQAEGRVTLQPSTTTRIPIGEFKGVLGPTDFRIMVSPDSQPEAKASRTMYTGGHPPPLTYGFSTYRAFRAPGIDKAFRDFIHETAKLGMQYVRLALAWEELEPEPGRYAWDTADQMLALADKENLAAFFWVFPTARGSGLGDAGIPAWALKEPAIDRHGNPGNFPCIWSPFYRKHYFAFLEALVKRYGDDPRVHRFVFDFGNSDFAYTYHFYGDRGDLFDYSPHERTAFIAWARQRNLPLDELARRWGKPVTSYGDLTVPLSEQHEAWLVYDAFRVWGVHEGIKQTCDIIQRLAPGKAPPDLPGHGLGSIADIQTYVHHAQSKHWDEVQQQPRPLTEAHNMGRIWGGEAWQVGGTYRDYDDALFQSVRLEAGYLTIPGPDLALWGDDLARIAMIRRTIAGAKRAKPKIAVMDHLPWHCFGSLAQIATRLDQPVDLLSHTCRFDYATYNLLVLPPDEILTTQKGTTSILPGDAAYYEGIHDAVARGLKVVVFPRTGLGDPTNPFRRICGLEDLTYGPRQGQEVDFPSTWGGGKGTGMASSITGGSNDTPVLVNDRAEALVLFRQHGRGGYLLCGYDGREDSLDAGIRYDQTGSLHTHTLARLISHLGLGESPLHTGQACCFKEMLYGEPRDFLLLYSHGKQPQEITLTFASQRSIHTVMDLADGRYHPVQCTGTGTGTMYTLHITLATRRGYYLVLQDQHEAKPTKEGMNISTDSV